MSTRLVAPWRDVDIVEQSGGLEGMRAILEDFYTRIFDDLLIGFFFRGRSKALLVERQLQFTARAFGADIVYMGASIPEAHAPLPPILAGHFDRRHKVLSDTLHAHQVPESARIAWLAFDRSFYRAVVRNEDAVTKTGTRAPDSDE